MDQVVGLSQDQSTDFSKTPPPKMLDMNLFEDICLHFKKGNGTLKSFHHQCWPAKFCLITSHNINVHLKYIKCFKVHGNTTVKCNWLYMYTYLMGGLDRCISRYIGRCSADYRSILDWVQVNILVEYRPMYQPILLWVDILGDSPILDRYLTNTWPIFHRYFTLVNTRPM